MRRARASIICPLPWVTFHFYWLSLRYLWLLEQSPYPGSQPPRDTRRDAAHVSLWCSITFLSQVSSDLLQLLPCAFSSSTGDKPSPIYLRPPKAITLEGAGLVSARCQRVGSA
jgi:hypothetical protein